MEQKYIDLKDSLFSFGDNAITFTDKSLYLLFKKYLENVKVSQDYRDNGAKNGQTLVEYLSAKFKDETNTVSWWWGAFGNENILGKFFLETNQDWPERIYQNEKYYDRKYKQPLCGENNYEKGCNEIWLGRQGAAFIPKNILQMLNEWIPGIEKIDQLLSEIDELLAQEDSLNDVKITDIISDKLNEAKEKAEELCSSTFYAEEGKKALHRVQCKTASIYARTDDLENFIQLYSEYFVSSPDKEVALDLANIFLNTRDDKFYAEKFQCDREKANKYKNQLILLLLADSSSADSNKLCAHALYALKGEAVGIVFELSFAEILALGDKEIEFLTFANLKQIAMLKAEEKEKSLLFQKIKNGKVYLYESLVLDLTKELIPITVDALSNLSQFEQYVTQAQGLLKNLLPMLAKPEIDQATDDFSTTINQEEETWHSYLPGVLPSIKEAEEEGYGSDHAPVFTTIQTKHFGNLKFLSLNAYVSGQGGMDRPYTPQNTEPKPRSEEKSAEMVNSIGVMVAAQQPDFVLLQEVVSQIPKNESMKGKHESLTLHIVNTLQENKVIVTNTVDEKARVRIGKHGNVMFHSNSMDKGWNMDDVTHTDISLKNDPLGAQINLFEDSKGNMLCLWNVHAAFSAFPDEIENYLHTSLEAFESHCRRNKIDPSRVEHIFGGDFNGDFAHVSSVCPVNCTNVATSMGDGRQTYKSPDGFFYATKNAQGNYEFTQPKVQIINPTTGKAITEKPKPSNFKSEAQQSVIFAQRPVLALDKKDYDGKIIDNKTIFEYESHLRTQLKCDQIIVRPTSDYRGYRGISIGFKQINQHDTNDVEQTDKNIRAKEIFNLVRLTIKDESITYPPNAYKTNMAGNLVTDSFLALSTMNLELETLAYLNEAMSKVIMIQSLIDRLDAYIQRIESYKFENDQTKIDYTHGFWFFAGPRSEHRRENYELAKQLRYNLKTGDDVTEVFSHIEKTGSTELNAIIEAAQKHIETSQKTLGPVDN